jgi:hypothetical protein
VEIALRFKALAPRPAFVIGLANGYIGYIPTSAAYRDGGYEVVATICASGSDVMLIDALRLLECGLIPQNR